MYPDAGSGGSFLALDRVGQCVRRFRTFIGTRWLITGPSSLVSSH
jgi:hypothetical protein